MIDIKGLLSSLIGMLLPLIPFVGSKGLSVAERAATIPEKDVRALCQGMTEEEKVKAVALGRKMADAVSDFAVYVASRGKVQPD